ncbi:glycoside hydrolase family 5 protein [Laetiporus sulphureus 93-53]|uniref:Glycoside hydrolase family 5 protein n=1 Tax=Laetiporus sulphureus 93-53 TaxID=1314785 RepID=A0A165H388_9APHY|nr:glycoside hydrolase family 5 protein [Laetiporus sulphureus 93-53]KZT11183.1 glycoside hydrolase family 5 protein [Laetiporus sulphureus 93-53]
MPPVPTVSPATGKPTPGYFIHTTDALFVDNAGRSLLLRGVNLSGAAKAPVGQPSQELDGFWETGEEGGGNFTGRPLNVDDGSADIHLARLRGWGYNMLRYVVTWEALEHAGPGKLDYEFMDYTVRVLRKCKEYGFKVYIDPHQDIWSRFSGGSGAPYWTVVACGFDPRHFTATQAAIIHSEYPTASDPAPIKLPAMIWSTNYGRLASQTLFTLFFAGRDYAPKCIIDGQNIQDYLQSHYIAALGALADRLRDAGDLLDECVIGWDSLNEPFEGFCGYGDLNTVPTKQGTTLKKGTCPTPAQSMRLGMGRAQTLDNYKFGNMGPQRDGTVTVDPKGVKAWIDPETEPDGVNPRWGWKRDPGWQLGTCVWALHGVWDVDSGEILVPDYFSCENPDHTAFFIEKYWLPHWQAFASRIRQSHPEAIMFVSPPVFAQPPPIAEEYLRGRCCYAAHYYDGLTLVTRHWSWINADALGLMRGKYSSTLAAVKIGEPAIRKSIQEQLGMLKDDAPILGAYPTIIGEIGVPFDMDGKKAYGYTDGGKYKGDFSSQQKALDASLNAADGPNALSYTVWNYCPDNSHMWGDQWDMEDLSIWSPDDLRPNGGPKMELSDASSAALLKKGAAAVAQSATTSTLSLATVAVGTDPTADKMAEGSAEVTSYSRWSNAYDFLTDGARAVKAFCRPFPVATVGVPKDIQFDIAKADFKYTVRVRPEDAPRAEGAGLATEIYVPLVHYASDKLVARFAQDDPERCETPATVIVDGVCSKEPSPYSSRNASSADLLTSSLASSAYAKLFPHGSASLSLLVDVSAGKWEVDGQTLKWWYPIPGPGEPEREYTITIKRDGGVIKTAEELEISRRGLWEQWCIWVQNCCGIFM